MNKCNCTCCDARKCKRFMFGAITTALLIFMIKKGADWKRDPNRFARSLYNLGAPFYDRLLPSSIDEVRKQLVEMMEIKPGDKVLEVSVGTGDNLPLIADKVGPAGRIYGLDISEGMLYQAYRKTTLLPCPVELRQGVAEELPFPDDDFDAVLHVGGINFFTDRKKALDEMSRVARPGAKIVVSDETAPTDDGLKAKLGNMLLDLMPRLRPPMELVPDLNAKLHYLLGGAMYAIEWRKPEQT